MTYELYYWTGIPGRGEFVRLALEEVEADYVDIGREAGDKEVISMLDASTTPSFAPPFLRHGEVVVGQTAAILFYLGPLLGLVTEDERLRLWTHQIQLTIADMTAEAHDVHHPLGPGRYYEDQKDEALRRAEEFRASRVPKFLGWFERILTDNPAGRDFLVGKSLSYADLSLFHLVDGLNYAFPRLTKTLAPRYPTVMALHERVRQRPQIATYLASDRRTPFNVDGIFRHYPELDAEG
ncbi:glutathione S-transferase [Devosia pacifica]|uniref:Glutathione S-transferase n=1 Tax=Devosia pacifica TaxID=1335967 RepID=A0A918S3Y0_9HYPH|nr:glutathione S-transferase [Devosia pacifica]GHA22688.1 glutathione S-transferase [Devosia pacifica]